MHQHSPALSPITISPEQEAACRGCPAYFEEGFSAIAREYPDDLVCFDSAATAYIRRMADIIPEREGLREAIEKLGAACAHRFRQHISQGELGG
jgi:hypothetical protein